MENEYPIKLMGDAGEGWVKLLYQTAAREWKVEVYRGASYDADASLTTEFYDAAVASYLAYPSPE
jgi:hypothetical protein